MERYHDNLPQAGNFCSHKTIATQGQCASLHKLHARAGKRGRFSSREAQRGRRHQGRRASPLRIPQLPAFADLVAGEAEVDPKIVRGILRHEDVRKTMQLYAQSDQESRLEAQGKFLALLLGDKAHLLMETIQ